MWVLPVTKGQELPAVCQLFLVLVYTCERSEHQWPVASGVDRCRETYHKLCWSFGGKVFGVVGENSVSLSGRNSKDVVSELRSDGGGSFQKKNLICFNVMILNYTDNHWKEIFLIQLRLVNILIILKYWWGWGEVGIFIYWWCELKL